MDTLVVGGGVAGSAVALQLVRRGAAVTLIDRGEFPRRKACGEGLFPAGARELHRLGVLDQIQPVACLEQLRFHGYGQSAVAMLGSKDSPALGIQRHVLDKAMLDAAAAAGVDVQLGVRALALVEAGPERYVVLTDSGELEPRAIVAADGLSSALRRQAGLEAPGRGRRYGVSAHVELPTEPEAAVDVWFEEGYEVYVTPVGGRVANVAVLMSKPATRALAGDASAAFRDLVLRSGALPGAWQEMDEPLTAGPFPARARRLWDRNLVLAGDAAGFFDGITGEGMSLALVSAGDCAEAVAAYLRDDSSAAFAAYGKRRRALQRNSELLGRLVLLMSSRPWLARRGLGGLARRPRSFSKLVGISGGDLGLLSLRPPDVAAMLGM